MPEQPKRGRPFFEDPAEVRRHTLRFRVNDYEWAELAQAFGGEAPEPAQIRDALLASAKRRNARK